MGLTTFEGGLTGEEGQRLPYMRSQEDSTLEYGAFVDAGVSMANNPALRLFLAATLKGFSFNWERGADKILLVSVDTGYWNRKVGADVVMNSRFWNWAREVPSMLMEDASWHNQTILQFISDSPTAFKIDIQIDNLAEDLLTDEPALSYLRYNVRLEAEALKEIEVEVSEAEAVALREMSDGRNRFRLAEIGEKAADKQLLPEHLRTPSTSGPPPRRVRDG